MTAVLSQDIYELLLVRKSDLDSAVTATFFVFAASRLNVRTL
jgi:hypothetical protein